MPNSFEGKLVRLRAAEPADDEAFRRWVREDTDSGRMTYRIQFPESSVRAAASEAKPQQGDNFDFVVETLDGVLVGGIDSHDCNLRCGTFSYGIGILPQYRGNGCATEAIRLLLRYFFHERRFQKCSVMVFSYNPASIRLHERLGFTLEARLRRMVYSGGEYHDELIYGMTREEFDAQGLSA